MNAPDRSVLVADVQSAADTRQIAIDRVGVKGVRYPLIVRCADGTASTIGTWRMTVALPADVRGTHMSRFLEMLEAFREPLDAQTLSALGEQMLARLNAEQGQLAVTFPLFLRKAAPVTQVTSLLDYEVSWDLQVHASRAASVQLKVLVPITSLCPCSKQISDYGAHNQRSHVTVEVEVLGPIAVEDLTSLVERNASCELYGLLKRADEKHVTEQAYRNPKFVEDLVRDIARDLQQDDQIGSYVIDAENFESIHNHSAYAVVKGNATASKADAKHKRIAP